MTRLGAGRTGALAVVALLLAAAVFVLLRLGADGEAGAVGDAPEVPLADDVSSSAPGMNEVRSMVARVGDGAAASGPVEAPRHLRPSAGGSG